MGVNWVPARMQMGIQEQVCPLLSTGTMPRLGTVPGIGIPKQSRPARGHGASPRTARRHSATEMGPRKLFSGMIRVKKKKKTQTQQKNPKPHKKTSRHA